MAEESEGKIHSGCTVVTAFIRMEDENKQQSFLDNAQGSPSSTPDSPKSSKSTAIDGEDTPPNSDPLQDKGSGEEQGNGKKEKRSTGNRIKSALKSLGSGSKSSKSGSSETFVADEGGPVPRIPPSNARRVLYCANAGDARGVLCRSGKAVRLTYDHKGSDKQEAKRIVEAGGFVMSGRVNGVLAVTRSLGDSSMKEFVVGAPYTTETELCSEDEFLILACDGVGHVLPLRSIVNLNVCSI